MHPWALIVVDEDATAGTLSTTHAVLCLDAYLPSTCAELHVKTVKYFKSIERVQDEVERTQADLKARGKIRAEQLGSLE